MTVLFFQPLFETMSKHVKVGLCGQGADELHAGYHRYRNLPSHAKLLRERLNALPSKLQHALEHGSLDENEGWLKPYHRPEETANSLSETLQFELDHGQLSNFQLRLVDRHSMAHSLEVRVPFLGRPHLESSNTLPMEWRLPPNHEEKAALREAANLTGLPKEIKVSQRQIAEALAEPVAQIIDTIKRALEQTPAELSADIVERGIMLTGGGSLLNNLDKVLRRSTSLPVSIAEDPLLCVVMGTG